MTTIIAKSRSRLTKLLLPGVLMLALLGWVAPSAQARDQHKHRRSDKRAEYHHRHRQHRWHRYRHYYYRNHRRHYYWDSYDEYYGAPPGVSIRIGL